jgi:ring-1,2-phenylacetyl-CoA epoxidase subunit PaaD
MGEGRDGGEARNTQTTEAHVRTLLEQVTDPEIPVVNVLEMGIVRSIVCRPDQVHVRITPTYSGCPAMEMIEQDIRAALARGGFEHVNIETVLSPAWTTDWLSDAAREKLRVHGIAPPSGGACGAGPSSAQAASIACPRCGSVDTEELSRFGSTACQALRRCRACREPFGYFKAI